MLNEAEESLASVQGLCDEFPKVSFGQVVSVLAVPFYQCTIAQRYSANPYVTVAPHILSNKENLERSVLQIIHCFLTLQVYYNNYTLEPCKKVLLEENAQQL